MYCVTDSSVTPDSPVVRSFQSPEEVGEYVEECLRSLLYDYSNVTAPMISITKETNLAIIQSLETKGVDGRE